MAKAGGCRLVRGDLDREIASLTCDSRKTSPGALFFCIKGCQADGHDYARAAASKGAAAIVCSRDVRLPAGSAAAVLRTEDTAKAMGAMAAAFYGWPDRQLLTVGVTGTKGKTTTTYMIKSILEEAGIKTGLIGTVEIHTGKEIIKSEYTTPGAIDLQRYLRDMADSGCRAAVIEVSSQALKLGRTEPIYFDCGVFTNIEEDHISPHEHRDFADYAACKAKLFGQCRTGVANGDDPKLPLITAGAACPVSTFGFGSGNHLRAARFCPMRLPEALGSEFRLESEDGAADVILAMPGRFNCSNALAAISACRQLGVPAETAAKALRKTRVPGRQEMFAMDLSRMILVDYAHNGMGLAGLLQSLREYRPSGLTCVFGCGGNRDPGRRKKMGAAAANYADQIIVTSDNPRDEDPKAIIGDIIEEIEKYEAPFQVIEDRGSAIEEAVRGCRAGEITVICGKGHEDYQILGDKTIHFDDREAVLASIEKVKHEQNYNFGNSGSHRRTPTAR